MKNLVLILIAILIFNLLLKSWPVSYDKIYGEYDLVYCKPDTCNKYILKIEKEKITGTCYDDNNSITTVSKNTSIEKIFKNEYANEDFFMFPYLIKANYNLFGNIELQYFFMGECEDSTANKIK